MAPAILTEHLPRRGTAVSPILASVVIPVLNGGAGLPRLLAALRRQQPPPGEIIVVDSGSTDGSQAVAEEFGCELITIPPAEFRHGRARNLGAARAVGGVLVFMTQDCLPADDRFLAALLAGLERSGAAAAYARQLAPPQASMLEQFHRAHHYPEVSAVYALTPEQGIGVGDFRLSNVAAAYFADEFRRLGGFAEDVIVNEDMHLGVRLLQRGGRIAYCSEARVYHGHQPGLVPLFRRYFDIGVFFTQAGDLLCDSRTTGSGWRYVFRQWGFLWERRAFWLIPWAVLTSGARFLGFHLGRRHRWLPTAAKRSCSGLPSFWMNSSRSAN